MTESGDYAFYREQTIKLIRQDGANQARLDGHDDAIDRIEKAVTDGFAKVETAQLQGFNALRGEMKAQGDLREAQRTADIAAITAAIDEVKQERANFGKALSRVGWAIIAAVVAAAATQYAALSPQVGAIVQRAAEQFP